MVSKDVRFYEELMLTWADMTAVWPALDLMSKGQYAREKLIIRL